MSEKGNSAPNRSFKHAESCPRSERHLHYVCCDTAVVFIALTQSTFGESVIPETAVEHDSQ